MYFNVGNEKANEILSLLNENHINKIKKQLSKGGRE